MIADTVSPCIATERVKESRDFYVKYFDAEVIFDNGWYVDLQIGNPSSRLQFMSPQETRSPACDTNGLVYNIGVEDVDAEHDRLIRKGLLPVMPLEDHPWGDRGFVILDPNGISLYIYSPREPEEEYQAFFVSRNR